MLDKFYFIKLLDVMPNGATTMKVYIPLHPFTVIDFDSQPAYPLDEDDDLTCFGTEKICRDWMLKNYPDYYLFGDKEDEARVKTLTK
jgi:hypothetical protein